MKKILILLALILLPMLGFAQSNHCYTYKSGSFDLETNAAGQKMVTHSVFDDYGALQYGEMNVMGQVVKTVMRDGKNYMVAPQFQEFPAQDVVNYTELTPEIIEQYGIQMVGIESMMGYDCMVYTLKVDYQGMEAKCKAWIWEGFTIRSEVTVMGMKVVSTIKNLELDIPVDQNLFKLPE